MLHTVRHGHARPTLPAQHLPSRRWYWNFSGIRRARVSPFRRVPTSQPHPAPSPNSPPLADEVREVIPTDQASFYLNRRPQTLREWACLQTGLLRDGVRRVHRLRWLAG